MKALRALFITILALSIALPPVAAAEASVSPSGPHEIGASSDCCPPGQRCNKQKGDCGQDAQCALKCASLAADVLAPSNAATHFSHNPSNRVVAERVTLRVVGPPPPPPRI
jgi:hypothetical protein